MLGSGTVLSTTYFVSFSFFDIEKNRSRTDNCEVELEEPLTFLKIKALEREWQSELPDAEDLRVIYYCRSEEKVGSWLFGSAVNRVAEE